MDWMMLGCGNRNPLFLKEQAGSAGNFRGRLFLAWLCPPLQIPRRQPGVLGKEIVRQPGS